MTHPLAFAMLAPSIGGGGGVAQTLDLGRRPGGRQCWRSAPAPGPRADQVAYANIATGYAAKQMCSCLHVSGRTLESCIADFPADARSNITITEDADTVRASVLFGAISSEAIYEEEFGCRIAD